MKRTTILNSILLLSVFSMVACNNEEKKAETKEPRLKEENVTYTGDNTTMNGYVVYDENIEGPRPAVIVIHEWWGLTDYPKMRAKELAKLGYIAFALDMFGNGKIADNPDSALAFAMPLYQNPQSAKARFDAALEKLKTYSQADQSKIAAIGYCFGGSMALNVAKLGEDLKGVVSFHGDPQGIPANKDLLKASILVCHGGADSLVPPSHVQHFEKEMDSIKASYEVIVYPGAQHAFSNPAATETGKKFNLKVAYDAAADTASWNDMRKFFGKIF
jgi:dienelactone hydrolase